MNPILHAILSVSNQIYDVEEVLIEGIDTEKGGYYFFEPQLASDYPMVSCDKLHWALYSSHHDITEGGLYWGKFNNLDLSDFEEGGLILSGYQAETPIPLIIDGKIGIYYHTDSPEPGNDGKQQTRLITSVGGAELHLMTWVDEGRPLGIEATDGNHTGYFRLLDIQAGNIIGSHITNGGLPQPWWCSVSIDGGYTFSREFQYDTTTGIESGYFFQPSLGKYFDYNGEQWWLGNIHPLGGSQFEKKMIIAKSVSPFAEVTQKAIIFPEIIQNVMGVRIIGDIAHIYFIKNVNSLWKGKFDLTQLSNL